LLLAIPGYEASLLLQRIYGGAYLIFENPQEKFEDFIRPYFTTAGILS
jgi:hypothetical protein